MRIISLWLLAILAATLSACATGPVDPAQASLERPAWYEVQVEEGLGHLDLVPRDWADAPR